MKDELRAEYDLSELLKGGVRGKYVDRYNAATNPQSPHYIVPHPKKKSLLKQGRDFFFQGSVNIRADI
ncbi:MAG: hypothetical protein ACPGWR_31660 [Ardenticatenaceae bacterium]